MAPERTVTQALAGGPARHPECPLRVDVRHRGDVAPRDWVLEARAVAIAVEPGAIVEAQPRGLTLLARDLRALATAGTAVLQAFGDAVMLERPSVRGGEGPPPTEPVVRWRVSLPSHDDAGLAQELRRRGAHVDAVEHAPPIAWWRGHAPLARLIGLERWLRTALPGASLSTTLSHYAPLGPGPDAA